MKKFVAAAALFGIVAGVAPAAFAQTSSSTHQGDAAARRAETITTIIANAKDRADREINRRISSLTELKNRISEMRRISGDEKTNLSSIVDAQIASMNDLMAKIAADASANATSSLKADLQSIAKSYRIYMLVIPQVRIQAAAERALDIADLMASFAGKLQSRIGNGSGSASATLADMNAKIADAKTQAQAAITEVAGLKPDNGDDAAMKANQAALKDARAKVRTAQEDLTAARKDAGAILKNLHGDSQGASTTASGTSR